METICYVFSKLCEMSLQASIAVAVVLVARELFRLFHIPKKYVYLLWIIPFIRLVCPFAPESQFSIMPVQNAAYSADEDSTFRDMAEETIGAEVPNYETTTYESVAGRDEMTGSHDPFATGDTISNTAASPNEIGMKEALVLIWLTGMFGIAVYSGISLVRFKKNLTGCVNLSEKVYACDYIDTALVMGIIRPKVYVPSNIGNEDMKYVILHETLHIRRLDYIIKPLTYLIVILHWFNPVVWLAFHMMVKDMEMSCDEAVIAQIGLDHKKEYAEALFKISTGRMSAKIPAAFAEGEIKGRIKNIMTMKRPIRIVIVLSFMAGIALAVVLLTNRKHTFFSEYSDAVEIAIEAPGVTRETNLGADGAILDYADDDVIIFHGWYGLFVYDRNRQEITDAINLYAIGCNYTQGDHACLVTADSNGKIYLSPMNAEFSYVYDILEDRMLKVPAGNISKPEENDREKAGYLYSASGLWYDLTYIEDINGNQKETILLRDYLDNMEQQYEQLLQESNKNEGSQSVELTENTEMLDAILQEPYYAGYQHIVDQYVTAEKEGWDSEKLKDTGLCLVFSYSGYTYAGYSVYDINGDGIKELLIGENGDDPGECRIYDIYTINEHGNVVQIANGSAVEVYTLYEDGIIGYFIYNGASSILYEYYTLSGTELTIKDSLLYAAGADRGNPWYYSNTESATVENGQSITQEQAEEIQMDSGERIYIDFVAF